jgi:hypothetical protein
MIMGVCPYEDCDGPLWIPMAAKTPAFQRHECETCKQVIWTRHSRLDPWSMTEMDFLDRYEVNEETMELTEKGR